MKRIVLVVLIMLPALSWAYFKPLRILVPFLNGVECPSEEICIDDSTRLGEAQLIYSRSLAEIESEIGSFKNNPRVVFCTSTSCFNNFGGSSEKAIAIGDFGIVIGNAAWETFIVKHEMIHHLQKERLGNLKGWLITPDWFIEGMAYSLSGDPRENLGDPWNSYRKQFNLWYSKIDKAMLWSEASSIK